MEAVVKPSKGHQKRLRSWVKLDGKDIDEI